MNAHRIAATALVGTIACSFASGCQQDKATRWLNEGQVCVTVVGQGGPGGNEYLAVISVDPGECMSCCNHRVETSCSISREGPTLVVDAQTTYTREPDGRWGRLTSTACCDACPILSAECEPEPLAAGTYTVVVGESEFVLEVPFEHVDECLGVAGVP